MANEKHEHKHQEEALVHLRVALQNIETVQAMIHDEKPCVEVVDRLSAIIGALIECRGIVARDHISSCISAALKPGQESVAIEVTRLFQRLSQGPIRGSHH